MEANSTKALSMKIVLVRWRDVETLSTSLKFTKQTFDGTLFIESLKNKKRKKGNIPTVSEFTHVQLLLIRKELYIHNIPQIAEQLCHLLLGGLGRNVGHLDDGWTAHLHKSPPAAAAVLAGKRKKNGVQSEYVKSRR